MQNHYYGTLLFNKPLTEEAIEAYKASDPDGYEALSESLDNLVLCEPGSLYLDEICVDDIEPVMKGFISAIKPLGYIVNTEEPDHIEGYYDGEAFCRVIITDNEIEGQDKGYCSMSEFNTDELIAELESRGYTVTKRD